MYVVTTLELSGHVEKLVLCSPAGILAPLFSPETKDNGVDVAG